MGVSMGTNLAQRTDTWGGHLPEMRVEPVHANAYLLRAPHFTSHSGYELAVRDAAELHGIAGFGQHWPRQPIRGDESVPAWRQLLARGAQRLTSQLAGMEGYSTGGLALELSAMAQMSRRRHQVFHFLYGENTCRFTPWLDRWRGNRVVATFHQTPHQLKEAIRRPGYLRRLGAAIILGRNQVEFLGQYIPRQRLHFLPHGVDTAYFRPAPERRRHDPPLCVSIGGHLRDLSTLRRAVEILESRAVPVQYEFIARGDQLPDVQGLPRARVRTWVDEEEFLHLYQHADVFVLPLYDAVASNTLLEALACGAPTVVTDVGAVRDYVDESCAAFARPDDPDSLADAIERCLRQPEYAAGIGAAGRARAEALDIRVVAGLHRRLYAALVHGHLGGGRL